ncbi:MAG: hypothetical protein OEQ25_00340 [Gammaproteobacteria bacterium]|nr:hypothetical protein [Gammaproteobacteria bacterium]MDH3505560.1 hypothetical protein [Gammaproteobacteria bacterium]
MIARRSLVVASALTTIAASTAGAQPSAIRDFPGVYVAVWVGAVEIITGPEVYPMTDAARQAYEAFDPFVSDPRRLNDCAPEKVPTLLWTANPIEIEVQADRIDISFEEGGSSRVIWLNGASPPADQPYTAVGYSVGHWEEGALVVQTTHMDSPTIVNDLGHPLSADAVLTERYWKEPGETTLRLEFQINDPANYTEPLSFSRIWEPSETEQVQPWECVSLGTRDDSEPPDFDELTRMLEELE